MFFQWSEKTGTIQAGQTHPVRKWCHSAKWGGYRVEGGGALSTWRATVEDRSSCRALARVIWGGNLLQTGLHSPDLSCVLGDGAVTGEFSTAGDVMDHLLGPLLRVLVNRGEGDIENNTYSVFYSVILDRIKHLKILKKNINFKSFHRFPIWLWLGHFNTRLCFGL